MSDRKKEYPQAELSRQLLAKGLLRLMEEKDYKSISVSELCAASDIARRTFYRHFETIDDVLSYQLGKLTEEFVSYFFQRYRSVSVEQMVIIFFEFWEQHLRFLQLLKKNHLLYVLPETVLPAMRLKIREIGIGSDPNTLTDAEAASFSEYLSRQDEIEYVFYFMSGGVLSLLSRWLESGGTLSPQEMGRIAQSAIQFFSSPRQNRSPEL